MAVNEQTWKSQKYRISYHNDADAQQLHTYAVRNPFPYLHGFKLFGFGDVVVVSRLDAVFHVEFDLPGLTVTFHRLEADFEHVVLVCREREFPFRDVFFLV